MRYNGQYFVLSGLFLLASLQTLAQSSEPTAKRFARYEGYGSFNRTQEDVATLKLSIRSEDRARIGIRVCSADSLPFALITAGVDPFFYAKQLRGLYTPDQIIFLRSADCLAEDKSTSIIEIWLIPQRAPLPPSMEVVTSDQVRKFSLGKEELNRGVRDYRLAVQKLIRYLRDKPTASGVVLGYYLRQPSQILRRRLNDVRETLARSGLSRHQYKVLPMGWNDEVSLLDKEPTYPSVFIVETAKPLQSASY